VKKRTPPTTKEIEKAKAKAAKEAAASLDRARKHKIRLAKLGDAATIPLD